MKGLKTVYVDSSNDNTDKNVTVIENDDDIDDNPKIVMRWINVTLLRVWKPFYCWVVRESVMELCLYLRRFAKQMTVIKQRKLISFI